MFRKPAFTCPHCAVMSTHHWPSSESMLVQISHCTNCGESIVWFQKEAIWPLTGNAPVLNEDMPVHIKADYLEARSIAAVFPRGAAALLRLAIDKLVTHLGATGKTIDDRIQDLVNRGLDSLIQQMLDSVRVIGNEQVHPGQIDIRDDPEMLQTLFWLVNEIVDERITKPNRVKQIYEMLPEGKRKAIEDRVAKAQRAKPS